jgi:hypothetical protein
VEEVFNLLLGNSTTWKTILGKNAGTQIASEGLVAKETLWSLVFSLGIVVYPLVCVCYRMPS